jgi:uncharacterized protein (DUF2384 family)
VDELIAFLPASRSLRARASEVIALAVETWEDEEVALDWFVKKHPLLDGKTPIQSMNSRQGCDKVQEILHGLQYGLPL